MGIREKTSRIKKEYSMNGKKAKRIRKAVYGNFSSRVREYTRNDKGMIINVGKRAEYLAAKKDS